MVPLHHKYLPHKPVVGLNTRVLGTELQTHQALTKLFNEEWPLPTGVVKTSNFSLRSTLGKGLYPQQHR